jgi:hypothetical protein
MTKKK